MLLRRLSPKGASYMAGRKARAQRRQSRDKPGANDAILRQLRGVGTSAGAIPPLLVCCVELADPAKFSTHLHRSRRLSRAGAIH
jgi:hypothetical protein